MKPGIPSTPPGLERRFRDFFAAASLRQPDAIQPGPGAGELTFRWDSERVVLIVELGPSGPLDVRLSSA